MIDSVQRGPYELYELVEAGVTPDTYVWCKGMDDWRPASEVADICRYFRRHISDVMHPGAAPASERQSGPENTGDSESQGPEGPSPNENTEDNGRFLFRTEEMLEDPIDTDSPPRTMLATSIALTLLCFPITGVVAIYYAVRTRRVWEEANRSQAKGSSVLYSDKERLELRREAHEMSRNARMWTGITFFIGIIFYSLMLSNLF